MGLWLWKLTEKVIQMALDIKKKMFKLTHKNAKLKSQEISVFHFLD